MTYTVPALRGRMGSSDYFQANISALELAGVAKTAGEIEDWRSWSIFERFQRELATQRVHREIVPYLVRTRDRFFGALIVLVYEPMVFQFEPITELAGLPAAYRSAGDQMGFLTIEGGQLVALDGQHRLAALREVLTAGNHLVGPYRDAVMADQLCVIFLRHETFEKTRRIFNKVNRYAKPTSPSDNIITSEDDGYAIITRWLVEPTPPLGLSEPSPPLARLDADGEPLVEWRSSSLGKKDAKFTTLTALYQTVQVLLTAHGIDHFDEKHRVNRPTDEELETAYVAAADWWQLVTDGMPVLRQSLARPYRLPDERQYRSTNSLLFRPVGLVAFFHGLVGAVSLGMTLEEAVRRAARLRWCAADDLWVDTVVFANGRMNAKESAIRHAGKLAAYRLAGHLMESSAVERLRWDLMAAKGYNFRLPRPPS